MWQSTAANLGWWRKLGTGVLIGAAVVLLIALLTSAGSERLGYDFRSVYLPAAKIELEGQSPYPQPDSPHIDHGRAYSYPPQLALFLAPFTALPDNVAAFLAFVGSLAAVFGALWIVGLRDVRCYAALVVWAPGWNALESANMSALLVLGVAVAWRFRAKLWPLAFTLGLVVFAKLFLWPLLVWAAASRRAVAALVALEVGLTTVVASWAWLGFAGVGTYVELVHRSSELLSDGSYSIMGTTAALGLSDTVGRAVTLGLGLALLGACAARAHRDDDLGAFSFAIVASLALTPIVWQHYLVLLAVPLAIARPRFSAVWLVPIVLWMSPRSGHGTGLEPYLPALVVAVLLASVFLARPRPAGLRAEPA